MTDVDARTEPENPEGRGIDRSAVIDSVQQDFEPKPLVWGPSGADGLPVPELKSRLPLAPPLDPTTFVCMADESAFVLRGKYTGAVLARFEPSEVERAPNGDASVPLDVAVSSGASWVEIARATDIARLRVRVTPVRPQCKFLAQQLVDFGDEVEATMIERMCTARRDDERFFMGLRDSRMYACELRSPRDFVSDERIKTFNQTKVRLGRERQSETGSAVFDVDAALEKAHAEAEQQGLTRSNIFGEEGR